MDTCRDWLGMCTASIYRYVTDLFQPTWLWVSITVNPMCKKHFFGWNHSQDFPTFPNLSWPTNLTLTHIDSLNLWDDYGWLGWHAENDSSRLGIVSCGWLEILLTQFTAAADVLGFRIKARRTETDRDGDVGTRWEHVGNTWERAGSPQQFWDLYGWFMDDLWYNVPFGYD